MRDYCTYFDHRYLSRGLVLYASLRRHSAPFRLWVLCLSDECHRALDVLRLPDIVPLRLSDLEAFDVEFLATKETRSTIEYYFTGTPALMSWLLQGNPDIEVLTYLDSDLYFFDSPDFLFDEFTGSSVQIVPHRFSRRNRALEKWGLYNVGWIVFRRDADGLACLSWWRRSCLDWCYDVLEADRFADQKYLDRFPSLFARVQVVSHQGVNLAPWNLDAHGLGRAADGRLEVDGKPLVFFHFHKLRNVARGVWRTYLSNYGVTLDRLARSSLYVPYLKELNETERRLRELLPQANPISRDAFDRRYARLWTSLRAVIAAMVKREAIWVLGPHVI